MIDVEGKKSGTFRFVPNGCMRLYVLTSCLRLRSEMVPVTNEFVPPHDGDTQEFRWRGNVFFVLGNALILIALALVPTSNDFVPGNN